MPSCAESRSSFSWRKVRFWASPLPARDNRRAILAYEATEGGAGVLSRLVEDSAALGKVARQALELMHFEGVDQAIATGDAAALIDRKDEACVRGCYRCLLSYFNQPDHELIDRTRDETKQLLIELARGQVVLASPQVSSKAANGWHTAFKDVGLPDLTELPSASATTRCRLPGAAISSPPPRRPLIDGTRDIAEAKGWTLFELPESTAAGVPTALIAIFKD